MIDIIVPSGIQTWDLSVCLYFSFKHGDLDSSATTADHSCLLMTLIFSIHWLEEKWHYSVLKLILTGLVCSKIKSQNLELQLFTPNFRYCILTLEVGFSSFTQNLSPKVKSFFIVYNSALFVTIIDMINHLYFVIATIFFIMAIYQNQRL